LAAWRSNRFGLITLTLFALSTVNLFTKQVATISGVAFTLVFLHFEISENYSPTCGKHQELDMFNCKPTRNCPPLGVLPDLS